MVENIKNGTFIHGIAASEHLDSSGERIKIEGVDISSLTKDGIFNYEHDSKKPSSTVGKILDAKKIFKKSDCENEHHEYFWDKVRMPFIYVAGELFDGVGHSEAKNVAAMLKYDKQLNKKDTRKLINFSIEGSRLSHDGSNIEKCVARKVAITITPCNKVCEAEELDMTPKLDTTKTLLDSVLFRSENTCEIMKSIPENFPKINKGDLGAQITSAITASGSTPQQGMNAAIGAITAPTPTPAPISNTSKSELEKSKKKKLSKYASNVRKALVASSGMSSPSTKTGAQALSKEDMVKICKSISEENWNTFSEKEELLSFLSNRLPNINKKEVEALAKTVAYYRVKKKENELAKLIKGDLEKNDETDRKRIVQRMRRIKKPRKKVAERKHDKKDRKWNPKKPRPNNVDRTLKDDLEKAKVDAGLTPREKAITRQARNQTPRKPRSLSEDQYQHQKMTARSKDIINPRQRKEALQDVLHTHKEDRQKFGASNKLIAEKPEHSKTKTLAASESKKNTEHILVDLKKQKKKK